MFKSIIVLFVIISYYSCEVTSAFIRVTNDTEDFIYVTIGETDFRTINPNKTSGYENFDVGSYTVEVNDEYLCEINVSTEDIDRSFTLHIYENSYEFEEEG